MSLLPPNASPLEQAIEQALAVPAMDVPLRELISPETCPEALLPWLAWHLSVDEWDASWPLATRRQVVARSMEVHRRKGTLRSVRDAVSALGGSISIKEWWETAPMGTPGTFSLVLALAEVEGATPSAAYIDSTIRQVVAAKPLSRSFDFTLAISAAGAIGVAPVARSVAYARLAMAA